MDIVAESLSAKILKSREVLVNGKDIMDYIRSKLSTAVEFSGVYDSLEEANAAGANFNGSIVIVGSTEYIWSDKDNSWHQIGDETAVGQLATDLAAVSGEVSAIFDDVSYIKSISANYKTYVETSTQLSSDGYALTADIPTYSDISSNIHLSDYALTNNVSTATELQQQFTGAKAYIDSVKSYADDINKNVVDISSDLVYSTNSMSVNFEGLQSSAHIGQAALKKIIFTPSYFGISKNDELESIVLQTRTNTQNYAFNGANIKVAKYLGNNQIGEIIGTSKTFDWPLSSNFNVHIKFNQLVRFENPDELYCFYCVSADQTVQVTKFGLTMYDVDASTQGLSEISNHCHVVGQDSYGTFAQFRPLLSVNYRHTYLSEISAQVDEKYDQLVGQTTDLSSADTIHGAKTYASDLVNSLNVTDTPTAGKFVVAVSQKDGIISVERAQLTIPEGLSSYADTVANLSNDGYVLSTELSTKNKVEISQEFEGQFVQTDLSIIKVVDEDLPAYATALHDNTLNPNALYVLQLSAPNAFGQPIHNIASGVLDSDAATYGQLVSANNAVSSVLSSLSTYAEVKQQLSADGYATQLNIPSYSDISINIHLSEYALANNVSSTTELNAKFNTLSTYSQTKQQLSSDGYALSSTTTQVANELSNAISSKVYVGNLQSGEHTDLSVLKVTANEYEQLVADANRSSVDLSNNVIYIVSSDNMNMYGEKILNLTMEEDDEQSEATNKHYVDGQLSGKEDISNKVSVLLSTSTDYQYPTAKCMYDIIGNIESALDIINNGGAQ